jgi:Trypsin
MRKLTSLLLTLTLLVGSSFARTWSDLENLQRRAEHWIIMKNVERAAGCTATAVSPDTLLTAHHCDLDGAKIYIDNSLAGHDIVQKIYDDHDSMLLVLAGEPFKVYVPIVHAADYRGPVQGERVYFWGNPHGVRNQYRSGYMTGATIDEDFKAILFICATPVQSGDSGSSIYGSDGRLLGVVTYGIFNGQFMGFFPIHFSEAQLQQVGIN